MLYLHAKGYDVRIVIEGAATKLIPESATQGNTMYALYNNAKGKKLIDGVYRACSYKMGTVKQAEAQG
jgi:hypothetical protein